MTSMAQFAKLSNYLKKHFKHSLAYLNNSHKKLSDYVTKNVSCIIPADMDYYMAYNGILWNRDLSLGSPDCEKLEKVLKYYEVNGIIVGHTVQDSGINNKCGGKVWRVDTGMSSAFGDKNNIQVLEILDNGEKKASNGYQPFRVL